MLDYEVEYMRKAMCAYVLALILAKPEKHLDLIRQVMEVELAGWTEEEMQAVFGLETDG